VSDKESSFSGSGACLDLLVICVVVLLGLGDFKSLVSGTSGKKADEVFEEKGRVIGAAASIINAPPTLRFFPAIHHVPVPGLCRAATHYG